MMIFDSMEVSKKTRITCILRGMRIIGVSASVMKNRQNVVIYSVLVGFTMIFDMMEVSRKARITRNLQGVRIIGCALS